MVFIYIEEKVKAHYTVCTRVLQTFGDWRAVIQHVVQFGKLISSYSNKPFSFVSR